MSALAPRIFTEATATYRICRAATTLYLKLRHGRRVEGADNLAETPWLAFVMRECGAVLIERGTADRAAMREMVEHLERGDLVSIFPEGTRTADGRVAPFMGGALLAARKAGVPIVPTAIRGAHAVWPRSRSKPGPGRIGIRFLPPIEAGARDALERAQSGIEAAVGAGGFDDVPPL